MLVDKKNLMFPLWHTKHLETIKWGKGKSAYVNTCEKKTNVTLTYMIFIYLIRISFSLYTVMIIFQLWNVQRNKQIDCILPSYLGIEIWRKANDLFYEILDIWPAFYL